MHFQDNFKSKAKKQGGRGPMGEGIKNHKMITSTVCLYEGSIGVDRRSVAPCPSLAGQQLPSWPISLDIRGVDALQRK